MQGMLASKDSERALMAMADAISKMSEEEVSFFVKQFKGSCNKCGKYGHKGADCTARDNKDASSPSARVQV